MKKISTQLNALADRTKLTEDTVDAALGRDRVKLQAQRDTVKASVTSAAASVEQRAAAAHTAVDNGADGVRASLDKRFAAMKEHADQRHADHDVKKADRHADVAEQDASDAIDLAIYVLGQAQYAIIDAVIARTDADALSLPA